MRILMPQNNHQDHQTNVMIILCTRALTRSGAVRGDPLSMMIILRTRTCAPAREVTRFTVPLE